MSDTTKASSLLSVSRLAFLNQQNDTALNLAKEAINLEPSNPDAYKCAGNALMSLERYDEAIKNYTHAVKNDPNNGNRYFDLGFAQATDGRLADAMYNLAIADELGCIPENMVQLYNLLGIICFDIGRYDDALINLDKAEQMIGIDADILQRKAIIHGMKNDLPSGINAANQLKLVTPSDYIGYKVAYKLLVQAGRLDEAEKELERAREYATTSMDYYEDCMNLEIERYHADGSKDHFNAALAAIEQGLRTARPTVSEAVESYINAAELYLQLEDPEKTIDCLKAAENPAGAFNNGFEIVVSTPELHTPSEYEIEAMIESDQEMIAERFGDYGLEELVESSEADEDGGHEFLTDLEDEPQPAPAPHKLDESKKYEFTQENKDQICRLYVGAYTQKRDYNKVLDYAKKMQASKNVHSSYVGKYTEANAMKELGSPAAASKYEETIKFFRNAMIKDPTDILAVTLRVQCYADIGSYAEAEELCGLLSKEMQEPLLEKINEAKVGGGDS
ncbi:MAG: tetratricopeptide repeat protein [Coriobacteriales bacterium]|jgi:tetratricopeptide (TPR) repeat protein|nr:tetratricopeptide repeat protein [Coriobacteriales bacterium]